MKKPKKFKKVVIPFEYPWNWSADYERQTALELAKKHEVIVYMNDCAKFFLKSPIKYPKIRNITFHQPRYVLPFSFQIKLLRKISKIIDIFVLKFSKLEGRDCLLWTLFPTHYFELKKILTCTTIYDCVDYYWNVDKEINKQYKENEKRLIKDVDHFFVNSKVLYDYHKSVRKPDKLLPQGFTLETFKAYEEKKCRSRKNRITIGFVGGINSRIDINVLYITAKNNPEWNFELWGPVQAFGDKPKAQRLINKMKNLRNVNFPGSVEKKDIPSVIESFTIGMIPYNTSLDFNLYCYPMKLFEYFYMGKPVISTPIEELKRFPKFVKIGKTAKEWENNIKFLLSKHWPKAYHDKQRKLAEENSWENKLEVISQIIEN